jgi:hypothetical protein
VNSDIISLRQKLHIEMIEIPFFPNGTSTLFFFNFRRREKTQFPRDSAQPVLKTANKKSRPGSYIFRKFTVLKFKKLKRSVQYAGLITYYIENLLDGIFLIRSEISNH